MAPPEQPACGRRPQAAVSHARRVAPIVRPLLLGLVLLRLCPASPTDTLTISRCISLALEHNPQVHAAVGSRDIAQGSFEMARGSLLPQVNLQAGYGHTGLNGSSTVSPSRSVGDNYSAGVQAQQLLLDFGRAGGKTRAAGWQWKAADQDASGARLSVALAAEIAYVNLQAARATVLVSAEARRQAQAHFEQAQALLDAGRGVRYNVVKAEVDLSNARLGELRAADAERSAHLALESALGLPLPESVVLADSLGPVQDTTRLDSAVSAARQARPELAAARLRRDAAAALLTAANRGRLPQLSGSAGYGLQSARAAGPWSQTWNAGLNLTLPLFTGLTLTGGLRQAAGTLAAAEALVDGLEQSVAMEVELQVSALRQSLERCAAADKAVSLAELALQLAQERYRLGTGSPLEMTDAEVSLTNARLARIQAVADSRIAAARLRRAMGL